MTFSIVSLMLEIRDIDDKHNSFLKIGTIWTNLRFLGKVLVWNDFLVKVVKGNDVIYFIAFRINIAVMLSPVLLVEDTILIITSTYLIVVEQIKKYFVSWIFYAIYWFLLCCRNFIA